MTKTHTPRHAVPEPLASQFAVMIWDTEEKKNALTTAYYERTKIRRGERLHKIYAAWPNEFYPIPIIHAIYEFIRPVLFGSVKDISPLYFYERNGTIESVFYEDGRNQEYHSLAPKHIIIEEPAGTEFTFFSATWNHFFLRTPFPIPPADIFVRKDFSNLACLTPDKKFKRVEKFTIRFGMFDEFVYKRLDYEPSRVKALFKRLLHRPKKAAPQTVSDFRPLYPSLKQDKAALAKEILFQLSKERFSADPHASLTKNDLHVLVDALKQKLEAERVPIQNLDWERLSSNC